MINRLQCRECRRLTPEPEGFSDLVADLDAAGLLSCPHCGHGSAFEKRYRRVGIKATRTSAECGVSCHQATSRVCKCSCAGASHGIA